MKYSISCVILLTLVGGIASIHARVKPRLREAVLSNFNPSLPRVIKAFTIQPAKSLEKKSHYKPVLNAVPDVLEVARKNLATKFAEFASNTSWLNDTLHGSGNKVTVFAFSDDAYSHSSSEVKAALADVWGRNKILQYHVASGVYFGRDISENENTVVYSLYPSPPFKPTPQWQFQPIQLDSYLVDSGGRSTVKTASGSPITKFDLTASNGIVHIIDRVMYPIPTGSNLARYFELEPKYSSLYSALETANLTLAISTPDFKPLTLLAPNNGAFDKLSKAQQELLKNTTILQQVLTYHVMVGSYYSAAIYEDFQHPSLEGSTIYFQKGAGGVSAEGKMVVSFDTTVTNGVVHELNGVMFPRSLNHLLSKE
ncbi:transforming growth factor-beta-induced protein ig-h3-like isoform X1 [Lytechinus variegatus]|uniref:transforming growth factor-beta-induced protein ig-h3-like isoform X1 n=1 Tax=Lytechinus variegatus TaxID=7654 RepID=UPI001BB14469|nr:transforming growth factor-beta-induced protein ig-h3-like isoform X1 [Lytechinus variegatus]XP_041459823.1 transforming growth factor-beta-induced protein ig-h3-like isoform X1 [Lytechinus variegatus]